MIPWPFLELHEIQTRRRVSIPLDLVGSIHEDTAAAGEAGAVQELGPGEVYAPRTQPCTVIELRDGMGIKTVSESYEQVFAALQELFDDPRQLRNRPQDPTESKGEH